MPTTGTSSDRREFLQYVSGSAVAVGATMLAGCAGEDDPGESDQADDSGIESTDDRDEPDEIQTGGELHIGMSADATSTIHPHQVLDTTGIIMCENIGNALVRMTPDGEVMPDLAESWEVSDDETTYTFQIREGVEFHEPYDREVTAEDVVENYHAIMDPDYGGWGRGQYTGILAGEGIDPEERIYQTGEYEVEFDLPQPFPHFFAKQARFTAFGWFSIVPMEAVEEHGDDFGTFDVGSWSTGPFMYNEEESTPGTEYVFDSNPNYFREVDGVQLPYADRLVYEIVPESSVRNTGLQTGDLHINENVAPQDIDNLIDNDDVFIQTQTGTELISLWVNQRNQERFSKPETRLALSYAADRETIVDIAHAGHGEPADGPLPPWSEFFNPDATRDHTHDPDRAMELLEEAGEEDLEFLCNPANEPRMVDQAEMLQQMYATAGIDMDVQPVSAGAAWDPMTGAFDDEDVPDPEWDSGIESYTWGFSVDDFAYSTWHPDAGWNRTYWTSDRMEELLEQSRAATDDEELQEIYDEFAGLISEQVPNIYLDWPMNSQGSAANVFGLEIFPTEYISFEEVWIDG